PQAAGSAASGYGGGQFWTPVTPFAWSELHAGLHIDGNAFNHVRRETLSQQTVGKTHDTNSCAVAPRCPVPGPDRHPDLGRHLIRQLVEREGRHETHDTLRHALRGLGEAVVRVQVSVWKLIDAARQAEDLTGPLHATH